MNTLRFCYIAILLILVSSCSEPTAGKIPIVTEAKNSAQVKVFSEITPETSGINFINQITENKGFNSVTYDGMLQGAGVGILDANNDGQPDVYFASNMGSDKLYLNKGDFQFEDVTTQSGIKAINWSTGIAVVDINNDGYDDIYVCKFMYDEPTRRSNVFYINNGDGTFTDKAKALGVADTGYSIMANFFDYDRDGDLDLYVANQPPNALLLKERLKGKIDYQFTDKLYRNDGSRFTDVTKASGITNYSYSLSATTIDYNKDGWPDLYVACDYDEADFFYKNNGNGTFTNVSHTVLKHMSNFSMGADVADINNDGHLDIYIADMVAEDNFRQKTNMSGMNPKKFFALADAGYHYQYMFNSLQLNNGDGSFSEIAQMSGVSNTDWSWTPLFVDFDQDGYKDLFVTNGFMREMRNKDFEKWRKKFMQSKLIEAKSKGGNLVIDPMEIVKKAPSFKIANYVFRNNKSLGFEKMNSQWGLDKKTWSQGAAYADFDSDGDLDLVINNMNMPAQVYKNTANESALNNYINIKVVGPINNKEGINASIEVETESDTQIYEFSPYRGYMSCSQKIAHFGLGLNSTIKEIRVKWFDNKMNVLQNVSANQLLTIQYSEANSQTERGLKMDGFFKVENSTSAPIVHKENDFDDYKDQVLLPYRTSTLGPVLTKGDLNGNGLEDLFVGSSIGATSSIYYNNGQGGFSNGPSLNGKAYEDGGAACVDIDGDGDQDLVVTSGGSEYPEGHANYTNRLYVNEGKSFKEVKLPGVKNSSSVVLPLDYDGDGDQDLFIGGRQVPGHYGKPTSSQILENNNGKFIDVTNKVAKSFSNLGMVTTAKLANVAGDATPELLLTGEWMAIRTFALGTEFKEITENLGLTNTKGWWNTIELADIDGDGDQDLIAGNLGHNIKYKATASEPFKVYVDDFDKNGTNDVYLGYYENGQCFPVRGKQCSTEQMPFVSEKFPTYKQFGLATIDKVLEDRIAPSTVVQEAQTFSNTLFRNEGGKFTEVVLPKAAQVAPVYGIAIDDFDKDGKIDAFLAGNMYQREVETTRSDAGKGCLLSFDGDKIIVKSTAQTGVSADKDVRAVSTLVSGNKRLLLIANNNEAMQIYSY